MKVSEIHSHLGGLEWLQMHHPRKWELFLYCLSNYSNEQNCEQTLHSKDLKSALESLDLNAHRISLNGFCFGGLGDGAPSARSNFQNYPFYTEHLADYVANKIDLGIEILPMKSMQAQMSSGPGYYEGALYDLIRQGRGVPAVPLVLIGLEP
ncbi:MAG: hypothetical protein IPP17_30570 [Bacteroidetes bacterium]|nr:hypothetical protein [Bacteroidota bacterium]